MIPWREQMLHKNLLTDDLVREIRMEILGEFTLTLKMLPFWGSKFIGQSFKIDCKSIRHYIKIDCKVFVQRFKITAN